MLYSVETINHWTIRVNKIVCHNLGINQFSAS